MRRTERRYNSQPESQRRLQPEYVERRLSGNARVVCLQQVKKASETTPRPCDGVTSVGDVTDDARMAMTMTLMAVKHYDPDYFSQSGCVEQELALGEGDIVRQLGMPVMYTQ